MEMRNQDTGATAPAHRLGTAEDGRPLYAHREGWEPTEPCDQVDDDGNWSPVAAQRLARDWWCTGLHGITGQPIEEGWLEAGALVRLDPAEIVDEDGAMVWRALASTDGGRTWYWQESTAAPELAADDAAAST